MKSNWLIRLRDKLFGVEKLEYRIVNSLNKDSEFRFKELKAIEILKPYFPQGFVFETRYSLSFQEIQHIANDIVLNKPKTILEIGSGLSTIILSNIISELDYKPEFISIDQSSEWQKLLKLHCRNVDFNNFLIGQNSEFSIKGGIWFEIPEDSQLRKKKFELVIIDGPKSHESKYARFGIVNFLKERITESTIIFIDDTNRADEKFLLNQLKEVLSFKICISFMNYSRLSNSDKFKSSPS